MIETITSPKIMPLGIKILGTSSTDGEDTDFLFLNNLLRGCLYPSGNYFTTDVTNRMKDISPTFKNETFNEKEVITDEILEHDIVVKMTPKKRYCIKALITRHKKAEPKVYVPASIYLDI